MPTWRSASPIFPGSRDCLRDTGSMKIVDIQWRNYRLPFVNSFSTAHDVMTAREGIIVEVTAEQGISGVGEIAPLPAFGGANVADARTFLQALVARLHSKTLYEALDLLLTEEKAGTKAVSTLCGLEIALLDVIGKVEGCGVCMLLSPAGSAPRAAVPVNAVIGARATEAAFAAAREARSNGFRCVKLKVLQYPLLQYPLSGSKRVAAYQPLHTRGVYTRKPKRSIDPAPGESIREEVERVAAVRDAIGPTMHLRLDANEAWNLEEAIAILSQCVPYNIQYVEQPLKAHDLAGMHTLRRSVPIPIAVDEALHSLESAQLVLDNEAADILVIKPQLAGGLRVGQQIIQAAAERGVRSVITGAIETGIGVVAALHLAAASPAVTLECGLATLHLLVDDLVMNDLPVRDGLLAVPTGPGLGIALDEEALHRYSSRGTN
jgi:L-alanine-DL-glutamate epimerase-like enolase superfamily enzyme